MYSLEKAHLGNAYNSVFNAWKLNVSAEHEIDLDSPVFDQINNALSIRALFLRPDDLKKRQIEGFYFVAVLPEAEIPKKREGTPHMRVFFSRKPKAPIEFFALQPGKYEFDQILQGKLKWVDLVLHAARIAPPNLTQPLVYEMEDPYLPLDENRDYPHGSVMIGGREILAQGCYHVGAGLKLLKRKEFVSFQDSIIDPLLKDFRSLENERASSCFNKMASFSNLHLEDKTPEGHPTIYGIVAPSQLKVGLSDALLVRYLDDCCEADPFFSEINNKIMNYVFNSDTPQRKFREQACGRYTLFAYAFIHNSKISDLIDAGANPRQILADHYQCSTALIQRLSYGEKEMFNVNDANEIDVNFLRFEKLLEGLKEVDLNLLGSAQAPLNSKEFYFLSVARHWEEKIPLPAGEILKTLSSGWRAQANKLMELPLNGGFSNPVAQAQDVEPRDSRKIIERRSAEDYSGEMFIFSRIRRRKSWKFLFWQEV